MEDIIIDASQYSNLKITYSEKNNIDNVKGKEYYINGISIIDFSFEQGNVLVDESGKTEINYTEHTDTGEIPNTSFSKINGNAIPNGSITSTQDYKIISLNNVLFYLRAEDYQLSGTFRAKTDRAILDVNSISVSCEITYDTYKYEINNQKEQPISKNYANSSLNPSYEFIRKPKNKQNVYEIDGKNETQIQTTKIRIPSDVSVFRDIVLGFIQTDAYITDKNISMCDLSKPRIINTDDGYTTVEVDFKISIWSAYNEARVTHWGFFDEHYFKYILNNVTSIQFKVQANGINTSTNEFKYGDGKYKEYELESNELMQYTENQSYNTRQSYITSQKMLDKTKINRMIVSFDLLKCDRIVEEVIREGTDNEERIVNHNYLDTGDLIKIKDQNDNFIGQYYDESGNLVIPYFEIISRHGRWDGTFHFELICKQKL